MKEQRRNNQQSWFPALPPFLVEGLILLLAISPLLYLAAIWSQLPDTLPMHYNMAGEVDRYGKKAEIWIPVIAVALSVYLILLAVPLVEKKEKKDALWWHTYFRLRLFLQVCLSGVAAWIVFSVHQPGALDTTLGLGIFLSVLFAGLGWIMPADHSHSAFQIKTPWTATNPDLEKRTRQLTRKIWMIGGLAIIPLTVCLPATARIPSTLLLIILLSLAPILYSWQQRRKTA